ncbi:MAG: Rnf-Nqr domain containing protein [Acutalibacteraceae bacterium]|nr:hypothetical protein [Bacillota bacterium]
MNEVVLCLLTALAAFTTENLLLCGGAGLSRLLRTSRKNNEPLWYAGLVTVFSLLTYFTSCIIHDFLNPLYTEPVVLTFTYAVSCAVWYLLGMFLLSAAVPHFFQKVDQMMPTAAINTVVMALPFITVMRGWTLWQGALYCVGSGAAFYLAIRMLAPVWPKLYEKQIPRALRGLPAAFLFLTLLALGLMGFTGSTLFWN